MECMQIFTFLGVQMIWRSPYRKIIWGVKFWTEAWSLLKKRRLFPFLCPFSLISLFVNFFDPFFKIKFHNSNKNIFFLQNHFFSFFMIISSKKMVASSYVQPIIWFVSFEFFYYLFFSFYKREKNMINQSLFF